MGFIIFILSFLCFGLLISTITYAHLYYRLRYVALCDVTFKESYGGLKVESHDGKLFGVGEVYDFLNSPKISNKFDKVKPKEGFKDYFPGNWKSEDE